MQCEVQFKAMLAKYRRFYATLLKNVVGYVSLF